MYRYFVCLEIKAVFFYQCMPSLTKIDIQSFPNGKVYFVQHVEWQHCLRDKYIDLQCKRNTLKIYSTRAANTEVGLNILVLSMVCMDFSQGGLESMAE